MTKVLGRVFGLSLYIGLVLTGLNAHAAAVCAPSSAPLFSNLNLNSPLPITVMVDYAALNRRGSEAEIPAVLAWVEASGPQFMPVLLKQRGNIRRIACTDVPYKINFLKPYISAQIQVALAKQSARPGSIGYMQGYYRALVGLRPSILKDASAQTSGLFAGIGKNLKVVSHCGVSDGTKIYANPNDWKVQNQRVIAEYYVYQILAEFNSIVEDARLVQIKYLNPAGQAVHTAVDAQGKTTHNNFAIFREPDNALAARCGLLTKYPQGLRARASLDVDKSSYFNLNFFNAFIGNIDFWENHNIGQLYDSKGDVYYAAYDFDLSVLVSVEYDLLGRDAFKKLDASISTLPVYAPYKRQMYSEANRLRPRIAALIERSSLTAEQKARFRSWFHETYQIINRR